MASSQTSAKKQQSISSFFNKRASTAQPAAKSTPSHTSPVDDDGELFLSSNEGNKKSRSNGLGQKIASHVLDANEEDIPADNEYAVDLPARKRICLSSDHSEDQNGAQSPKSHSQGRLDSKDAHNVLIVTSANGVKKAASKQTSKYAFSSSPNRREDAEIGDDEMAKKSKEALHAKFVKKLGRPDSIAEIKRRNWLVTEETQEELVEDEEDDEPGENSKPAKKASKAVASKKGASKLTPMEKQYLDIKRQHLDTLLVVEVGYKFKFFGEDARLAARELSIVCIPGKMRYDEHPSEAHYDRFASASIPVHRLHVHVKRLVSAGLKVGVVRQIETAALKAAGDNRNAPFVRKLTNLYTKGTYIDDVEGLSTPAVAPAGSTSATGYLLCMTETNANGWGTDEKVHVGMIAVQPATGDIIYDDFEDGFMRSEIETRLLHIAPCEILVVGELSKGTEKLVRHISGTKTNVFGDKVRLEKTEKPKTMAASAYSHVANFYAGKVDPEENSKASKTLDKVLKLAESTTICLSAMVTHLAEYGLEHVFDLTKYFQSFSARSHMLLNGTSLTSLEIYQNQTDHTEKGSLFWTLNRTKTRFGQRLLRTWVGRPLLIRSELEERIAAVEELKEGQQSVKVDKITYLLSQIRTDLEKSLIRIYYGKCTRPELLVVLQTLQKIASEYGTVKSPEEAGYQSAMINNAIAVLPTITGDVVAYLEQINLEAAKADDKYSFFRDEMENDDITAHKLGIASVEQDLDAHRAVAAEKLKRKKVDYVTSSAIEYLIEIDNGYLKNVPASWAKISGTKKVSRFHTPEVVRFIRERDQHREALAAACDTAFSQLLNEISAKYQTLRDCVQALSVLDCLLSLAAVASQPGYVKPEFTDSTCIHIDQGRHPMVEQLLLDTYVPNDTDLASDKTRALLITGPNMGGKSSYVRQVALISIMGQIGSYIPAQSATLGMLDGVFTRMGAFDNMMAGESTFMVELSETSDILKQATQRSLIILDELGRGTSTHDGVAIAHAVLDHLVRHKQCLTLFITHYQNLSTAANRFPHAELRNAHMRFTESSTDNHHHRQEITFLYEIAEGVAHRSYGLNVARLANVPEPVLDVAAVKSREMEDEARSRGVGHLARTLGRLFEVGVDEGGLVEKGDGKGGLVEKGVGEDGLVEKGHGEGFSLEGFVDGVEQL